MFSILLLVYLFRSIGIAVPLPVTHGAITLERDLETCSCPSEQRTIWTIVWGCLATVFTCTWVSVHPNMPAPEDPAWKVAKRRAGLMIWTIIAPELVILWALRQWLASRLLADKYSGHGWTKTHGYFLQMGGFALYEGEIRKKVLSAADLEELFTEGQVAFPTTTEEEIVDRSKGDGLSKTIAICQTTWFVAQCIARHAQGLVVTELEIVTVAFAALNGIMYFLWWNKPLDVRCSIPVSFLPGPNWTKQVVKPSKPKDSMWQRILKTIRNFIDHCSQKFIEILTKRSIKVEYQALQAEGTDIWNVPFSVLDNNLLSPAWAFINENMRDDERAIPTSRVTTRNAEGIGHWSRGRWFNQQIAILVMVIGTSFGAIHCTAWSSPFPSGAERVLWRVCSLILLSTPPLSFACFVCDDVYDYNYIDLNKRPKQALKGVVYLLYLLIIIGAPLYAIARLILIVEAFIGLRALTPGALAELEWSSIIPHI
ncbi:hypothetical protein FPV67DRAFT_1728972 [Lyophyllum atratum]|nr:hypothetical protein FPV67DRAFT_1728972 [Lyophyllum atratum]